MKNLAQATAVGVGVAIAGASAPLVMGAATLTFVLSSAVDEKTIKEIHAAVKINGNSASIYLEDSSKLTTSHVPFLVEKISPDIFTVDITNLNCSPSAAEDLLKALILKPNIRFLMASCRLDDNTLKLIAPDLKSNTTLQSLDISDNKGLTAASAPQLRDVMLHNRSIVDLKYPKTLQQATVTQNTNASVYVLDTKNLLEGYKLIEAIL